MGLHWCREAQDQRYTKGARGADPLGKKICLPPAIADMMVVVSVVVDSTSKIDGAGVMAGHLWRGGEPMESRSAVRDTWLALHVAHQHHSSEERWGMVNSVVSPLSSRATSPVLQFRCTIQPPLYICLKSIAVVVVVGEVQQCRKENKRFKQLKENAS